MIKKNNLDKYLVYLIIISLINSLTLLFTFLKPIRYMLILLTLLMVLLCPFNKSFVILLYLIPNQGLYDDIGFKQILNISIFIIFIKLLYREKFKIPYKNTFLLYFIILYEIILTFLYGSISFKLVSILSLFCSYMVFTYVIYYLKTGNLYLIYDKKQDYKFILYGLITSVIYSGITVFKQWGIDIPTAFRFTGLLRDPNYYSLVCLIVGLSLLFNREFNLKKRIMLFIITVILGILSVSKMFMLLLFISLILIMIYEPIKTKKINKKYVLAFFISIFIGVNIFINSPIGTIMLEKYLYRGVTTSLFTGRNILQPHYIDELLDNPRNLLVGNTLTYYGKRIGLGEEVYYISDISSVMKEAYSTMVAHNTYLDVILSWGIIGGSMYIIYIINSLKYFFVKKNNDKFDSNYNIIFFILLISFTSLSLLEADMLMLLVSFILCERMKG